MSNPDEWSDPKFIDNPNQCYEFDHDGKFCDVWYLIKEKYPHIMDMKDVASATLIFVNSIFSDDSYHRPILFSLMNAQIYQLYGVEQVS